MADELKRSAVTSIPEHKRKAAEKLRGDIEAFLQSGGQIRRSGIEQRHSGIPGGYNNQDMGGMVDRREVADILGVSEVAILTAKHRGRLNGFSFPKPMPREASGREIWRLCDIIRLHEQMREAA